MAGSKKQPLTSSSNANIDPAPPVGSKKTIEQTYQKKSQLEHILLRPDTYIGSVEKHEQRLWVYEDDRMVQKTITYVPGLYKIFDEILVNAADNKQRDPKMNSIKVSINVEDKCISVYNNGDGVPVEIHQEEGVYVPELIFGHLLTSSNYDDNEKKTTGGRNGYGAKLTNIFSKEFVIETADGKRLKTYKQVFSNNMGTKSEPVITKCKAGENWTKITFKPDLSKFGGMTELEDDVVALMKKRVIDIAGCLGNTVKVELDAKLFHFKSFANYCDLYLKSPDVSTSEELPRFAEDVHPRWQVCISRSEGQFQQVSFVNGIATIKGGTHVDYVTNKIIAHLINKHKNNKKNKIDLKPHNVRNHLWVFVNALIDNPAFDSQTKETLTLRNTSFGSKWEFRDKFLDEVAKSEIMKNIEEWADFKQQKDLKKTDGSKSRRLYGMPKLADANWAGGKDSEKCTLILTEGDSAKTFAITGLSVVGRDKYGVFPLRGKLLNVREASHSQLMQNAEINNIKTILGLQQNKQYENAKSLRYGHLMIMTDQDHDGSHIKGLLINFIHTFWPSLLKVPSFLLEFITPIVRVTNKYDSKKKLSFYSIPDYEEWMRTEGARAKAWKPKYYKGLGTSNDKEAKEYFNNLKMHQKNFVWEDQHDGDAIELAFSKKKIEARKSWLLQYEPGTYLNQKEEFVKYSDFVHKELILFSRADVLRSIPSMVDGMKPGQRKVLYCAFKKKLVNEIKIAEFAGYVSEQSAYHHGEQSLAGTIIGMAQNYVGSNNINLLVPSGQFGSRSQGGKDHASARYINTNLSPITRFLFPKDDDILLDYLKDDGKPIEPTWYVPIIPLVLVNGSEGIGTGWSTFVPNYNPKDIIANTRNLLNGEPMYAMHPWYKGFSGTIEKTATKDIGFTYTVSGVIDEVNEKDLRITELPIRKWSQDYKEFLESVTHDNDKSKDPFIQGFSDYSDGNIVYFKVSMSEDDLLLAKQEGLLKKFKLTTSLNTSNMHLFDSKGQIKKYETPEHILEEFYHIRLEYYVKRRKAILAKLELDLLQCENKVRFIQGVVADTIPVRGIKKDAIVTFLREAKFTPFPSKKAISEVAGAVDDEEETQESPVMASHADSASDYDYLLSLSIGTLTLEKINELKDEMAKLREEVKFMKDATPKIMWMKELDALEVEIDKLVKADEDKYKEDMDDILKKANNECKIVVNPRKKNKKASNKNTATEPMDVSVTATDDVAEVKKAKGRAPAKKKAPAKKAAASGEDDDEEVASLRHRLAAYNMDSSPDRPEDMESDVAQKKVPKKRAVAPKKSVTISDGEDDTAIASDDDDGVFEIEDPKKKGGRKTVKGKAGAASKPPTGPKKRGPASKQSQVLGQKLITDVLKPTENSPEKKVRKMRASPFNKKSSSILGQTINVDEEAGTSSGLGNSNSSVEEAVFPRVRPQRSRVQTKYVISDDSDDEDDVYDMIDSAEDISEDEDEDED